MNKILSFFSNNSLLANFMMITVIILGAYFWRVTPKEDMPNMTFNRAVITASYPGASPEDVERYVTSELESAVTGIDGVVSVTSTTSKGSCSVVVEMDERGNYDTIVTDIRTAAADVNLPEGLDDPVVRIFKSSQRAVIDIVLYKEGVNLLDNDSRTEVQDAAMALQNQLESMSEVTSADISGYHQKEIWIEMKPDKMEYYEIPFNTLASTIRAQNIRQPAGELDDDENSLVSIDAELDTVEELEKVVVRGSFSGPVIYLSDVADIKETFEDYSTIRKINGHEAVTLRVVKSADSGIISAVDIIRLKVKRFENTLSGSGIKLLIMDDESVSVRNRLSLIAQNGGLGFILIIILLFIFLDFKSGFWVGMGIPFSFCFTMILTSLMGMTINNMTLSAVIIVMGMVVDDAIIVTENITRLRQQGMPLSEAAVSGTAAMVSPVIASVITTCVAFVPLLMFSGFAGRMGKTIPPVIIAMLLGSLFEALFILPSHMSHTVFKRKTGSSRVRGGGHWFFKVENGYGGILNRLLKFRFLIIPAFLGMAGLAYWIYSTQMHFSLFPGEESDTLYIDARTPAGSSMEETERASRDIEAVLESFPEGTVESYITSIAAGRFGSTNDENRIFMQIILPETKKRSGRTKALQKELDTRLGALSGFEEVSVRAERFGFSSGSAMEIKIQENDSEQRNLLADRLVEELSRYPGLTSVETDTPRPVPEYKIDLDRVQLSRLSISASSIKSMLNTALDGIELYDFPRGNDEVDVRLITAPEQRENIDTVFNLPVENSAGYLVPLKQMLIISKVMSDTSISRIDSRRTTTVYADPTADNKKTLLVMADELEENVFPKVLEDSPGSVITFGGEIEETRKIGNELLWGILFVILMIYMILALTLKSLFRPFIIMLSIPFGAAGVIFAFRLHGITTFGFYAAVGVLGLSGVVVNDSIVMLDKLRAAREEMGRSLTRKEVAETASTRLRAIILTTVTTVIGLLPTAYGVLGYDALLSQMMLALAYGLIFGTLITLVLVPSLYMIFNDTGRLFSGKKEPGVR